MTDSGYKVLLIIIIQIAIALVHFFRLGQIFDGQMYDLYYGYASDIILPFGLYFLLTINCEKIPMLRHWYYKAGIIFFGATIAEICQLFGIYALGTTFDPIDIMAYGAGVLIAAFLDVKIFNVYIGFWATPQIDEQR
jgi:hypothetical protein